MWTVCFVGFRPPKQTVFTHQWTRFQLQLESLSGLVLDLFDALNAEIAINGDAEGNPGCAGKEDGLRNRNE